MNIIEKNLEIKKEIDLIKASAFLNELLKDYPINFRDSAKIVVSELATNILKNANSGKLNIFMDNEKIIIKTFNIGKLSIFDFIDGISNKSTLGVGLGVAGRSSDEFYYTLTPVEITWIKYLNLKPKNRFAVATKVEPLIFAGCGDRIIKVEQPSFIFIALLDVAGHGRAAGEVAHTISKFIENHYYLELSDLMQCLVEYMKDVDRRFVVEFLKLWKTKEQFEFCGVGDVSCKIFYNDINTNTPDLFRDDYERLITKNGVLGGKKQDWMKNFLVIRKDIPKNAFIVMFSDGISSSIKLDREHFNKSPQQIIDDLFNKYKKEDDRSLVIIKCS